MNPEHFDADHTHTTPAGRHFRHGDGAEVDGDGSPSRWQKCSEPTECGRCGDPTALPERFVDESMRASVKAAGCAPECFGVPDVNLIHLCKNCRTAEDAEYEY